MARELGGKRMKRLCLLTATLTVAALVGHARADEKPAAADKLAPLARFVGEWEVDGTWSDGKALHARGVYSWGLGKTILHAKTFVRDGDREYQRYEGVMA